MLIGVPILGIGRLAGIEGRPGGGFMVRGASTEEFVEAGGWEPRLSVDEGQPCESEEGSVDGEVT